MNKNKNYIYHVPDNIHIYSRIKKKIVEFKIRFNIIYFQFIFKHNHEISAN